jgi:hypothetical protein
MNDLRMETSQRINMLKEMRLHYKFRRNRIAYTILSKARNWLASTIDLLDKLLE